MNVKSNKMNLSLMTILIFSFVFLNIIALIVSGGIQTISFYRTQQTLIEENIKLIASKAGETVRGYIQAKISNIATMTRIVDFYEYSQEKYTQISQAFLGLEPSFRNLVFLDFQGRILTRTTRISVVKMDEFTGRLNGSLLEQILKDKLYTSQVYIDGVTGEPLMIIAVQEKNALGDIRGTFAAEMNLKYIWEFMDTLKIGKTGNAYIVDRNGNLIAYRDSSLVLKGEKINQIDPVNDFIKSAGAESRIKIKRYKGIDNSPVMGTFITLGTPDWALVTEIPDSEANAELISNIFVAITVIVLMSILAGLAGFFLARRIAIPLKRLTKTAVKIMEGDTLLVATAEGSSEVKKLAESFNSMTARLRDKMEAFKQMNDTLGDIINISKEIVVNLNSSAREIEAAAQEQTSASNEHASGVTEVSATLQELTITAKQITGNVGELVQASEKTVKLLKESETHLIETVSQLEDVGVISRSNTTQINELGKRSILINEMVELIKEVANKTNILSINASIEASRRGDAATGFSAVAAEIRELSKETIESAKKTEVAAKEITDFLNSIIKSSENESRLVLGSGKTVKSVFENVGKIVSMINNNYSFTQKINVSIKQQESGSVQAAETMKQMAEISRQSAETARQILLVLKNIVSFSAELEKIVNKVQKEDTQV